ncbi:MAG: DNA topoisomerase (ATP-hydrolyzing) subunit B [Desulfurella sp.]|uniref:DNA topoisomerase (ATP-hydrolyzing) subunit B n=1 Tax=Desulfurella sp. TaxID=1962857 RepID=UPI003C77310A
MTANYTAESIKILKGLDGVRKRPAMYIGNTSTEGLHHLIYEIVDNSIDESMAGFCDKIEVTIHKDNSVTVKDNGRGIPTEIHKEENIPAVTLVLTTLHSGGKFDNKSYRVSGGLHGVGISVVNALSSYLKVEIHRNGFVFEQEFERGIAINDLKTVNTCNDTGTIVTFKPDELIFSTTVFNYEILEKRLQELAFLNKNVTISLTDERTGKKNTFCYENGIVDFINYLCKNKEPLFENPILINITYENTQLECAFVYTKNYESNILSFANSILTQEGGTHLSIFKTVLTKAINNYAKKNNLLKNITLSGEDCREGLIGIVSIKLPNPEFEGQTKTKLGNLDIKGQLQSLLYDKISDYFEEHPNVIKLILEKAILAYNAREAAKSARELVRRKTVFETKNLPGKLADCQEKDPEKTEIFIVEGDSAGGSAKQARDRKFQAILPIKGKILNTEKSNLHKILSNEEIKSIVAAIGCNIDKNFNIDEIRYHKIIIMTDADVDGSHIQTLLLTFFYNFLRPIIEKGYLYIAQPPLYRVRYDTQSKYFKDDIDLRSFLIDRALKKVSFDVDFNLKDILLRFANLSSIFEQFEKEEKQEKFLHYTITNGIDAQNLSNNLDKIKEALNLEKIEEFDTNIKCSYIQDRQLKEFYIDKSIFSSKFYTKLHELYTLESKIKFPIIALNQTKQEDKDKNKLEFNNLRQLFNYIDEISKKNIEIQRYKGLGEMNPTQLWETTMNPATRTMHLVTIDDFNQTKEIFELLMGDKVEPRRKFIEENAKLANLDV